MTYLCNYLQLIESFICLSVQIIASHMLGKLALNLESTANNLVKINKYLASYVGSLDQSTTSTKFSIFKQDGTLIAKQILQHKQITPKDGWLEHDPIQILSNVHKAISIVMKKLQSQKDYPQFNISQLLGIGICNQRQTIVCWDQNGKPLHNAIVWCDSRTQQICNDFIKKYGDFKVLTGLPVSPYFSLFKAMWLIDNVPQIKHKLQTGKAKFGTIDSWLAYNLTGKHITDASNASRTYLCNLNGQWDESLLKLFKIRRQCLPQIVGSFQNIGNILSGQLKGIPICSVMGDQQSSAYAHHLKNNQMKITYGTGCFLLCNIGKTPKIHDSFVTTILNKRGKQIQYAYQASVECGGGTLNWAKRAGFFQKYSELNHLKSNQIHQELHFYPSFGSIFAPYWKSGVQGAFVGLNFNTTKHAILTSILEAITFRLYDNIKYKDFDEIGQILVDGGMTVNHQFMQLQANVFGKSVRVRELDTCWGVAKGVLVNQNIQIKQISDEGKKYLPQADVNKILMKKYSRWLTQRNKLYGWKDS